MRSNKLGQRASQAWLALYLRSKVAPYVVRPDSGRERLSVDFAHDGLALDARFERVTSGIRLSFSPRLPSDHARYARHVFRAYAFWFAQCQPDVRRMTVATSDGNVPSSALFAPSGDPTRFVMIPDADFFRNRGFERQRLQGAQAPGWGQRSEALVWRGGGNGDGRISFDARDADDPAVVPRLRLVAKLKDVKDADVKLSHLEVSRKYWTEDARRLGFLRGSVPAVSWTGRKFAIDIDGCSNTWSNLFVRLLYGCCVLKVGSQMGFRQWYYDRLVPFEHYVPVKPDMSDLLEKIEWVRANDSRAKDIAVAGQRLAASLDFETGRREAVEIISSNWRRS